jgi:hypothetical protein
VSALFWPNIISDEELWSIVHETPLEQQINCRKWKWIGHNLRKGPTAIENQALKWNPQTTEERKARDDLQKNSGRGSRKARQNMEGS